MDGTAAILSNLEALKRILAGLFAMAGLASLAPIRSPGTGERWIGPKDRDGEGDFGDVRHAKTVTGTATMAPTRRSDDRRPPHKEEVRLVLPRHLRLAILRVLRPAESAARRLIIASARGLVVTLPPPRQRKPKPATMEPQLRRFGIAVVVSTADIAGAAARILPRLRGRGTGEAGGGGGLCTPCLPLFDPPRRILGPQKGRRTIPAHAAPRISFPGSTVGPHPEVRAQRASKDDLIDATRVSLRLAALAAALDDLPGQAKRFARWKARRVALILPCEAGEGDHAKRGGGGGTGVRDGRALGRIIRTSPLRPGRPPGGRLARFDPSTVRRRNIREVDEILAHAHALALYALQNPDTS